MATATRKKEDPARLNGDRYFNLVEHAADGIAVIQDGAFKMVNTALSRISGYGKKEMLGMPFTELLTPQSQKLTLARYQARVAGKKVPPVYEIQAVTKDGKIRDIEVNVALTEYEGRVADEVIIRDITERKKTEAAIKKAEQEKAGILNSMSELVIFQDFEHRIIWTNTAAAESVGVTAEQLVGRHCYEIWPQRDKPCAGCPVAKARRTGKPQKAEIATPDGRVWLTWGYPMRDENGVITGLLEVSLDITERKQAREALQTEKNKLQSLIDAMEDGLTIQDKDYNILYQTEPVRRIHGDHPGEKCYRVYEGRDKICDGCPVEKAFKDGQSHTSERKTIAPSGEVTFWENTASPIKDANEKVVSCLEITRDITERKQVEEALQQSEKKYKNLAEATSDMIWEINEKGTFTFVSPRIKDILGYEAKEVAGKMRTLDLIAKAEAQKWLKRFKKINAKKEPFFGFEITHLHKNGTPVLFETSGIPTFDNAGNFKGYVGVNKDITERKRMLEALQTEKNKLQSVINAMEDDLSIQDKDYNIIYQNEPSRRSSGGDRTGEKCYRAYEGRDKVCDGCPIGKAFKDGKSHTSERKTIAPSGEVTFFETTANPIRDAGGNIVSCLEIGRNITERKRMEEQLREKNEQLDAQNEELRTINEELQATEEELQNSQERLERMFESVTDSISVINLDGIITKVNRRTVEIHGFASEDEILGRNAFDLVAPRDHERIAAGMHRALTENLIIGGEYTLLKADGSEFPGELSTSALKDGRGNVMGHITIARDVTKRKQMEDLFKTVTNSSPVGIYIFQSGKFQMANPHFQKLTGYTAEELTSMNPLELVIPEDRDMVRKKAVKMLKGERSSPYQFRVINKSGEARWVMETVTSIEYRGKRATLGNYLDITERKQAEEREKQLEQELNLAGRLASIGQLAAGVAHEINNPLTGVIGFSHLMMNRDIPNDMKQDLQVINSEAQRVAKIVENLLVFAHQRKTGREYVAINDIITKVLELRTYEMRVNNIEVETRLDPNLPLTMADTGQLQQVFLNIVLNAEYSMTKAHHKGNLLVKTGQINGNIRASITDNGAGISRENLDKIFNPFFTTKEVGKGTGLGLSICHGIITQHDGRIYARSEPGKGATFVIELPIAAEPTQADKASKTKKEPEKPRGAKILVVDDEEAILTFLHRLLTDMGHSVETINSADAALERLKTERYSLILLDIKLPGMSGIELYRHIEEIAPALTRRVMFITGDIMEGTTRDFLEKAGVPHITKPLDIEVLKKMINSALNQTQVAAKASG
jgi:PAS domain S-box-containing protein